MVGEKNSTFCGAEPTWANACVGDNGSPGYVEYSKGFSSAANLLIDQVLVDGGIHLYVDTFIYPVCFNMRHSVELRLKGAIEEITRIAEIKGLSLLFDLSGSHDIGNIWGFFKEKSELLDGRYAEINSAIESTITDIAEVDATGQTFRYPLSVESQKHLTDVAVINFVRLKERFGELECNLDYLHNLNLWLRNEYSQGTFTTKLSRPMLYRLARELPQKKTWAGVDFGAVKAALRGKFGLTSNDLSRAINKIKEHYTLSSMIGELLPLKGVTEEEIILFFDCWIKLNSNVKERGDDFEREFDFSCYDHERMIEEMHERVRITSEIWPVLSRALNPEFIAGIRSLFYFARDKEYTEYYGVLYEYELSESKECFKMGEIKLKDNFMHIFRKSNAMDNILMSLYALGHRDLAEDLISRYEVEAAFHWLGEARSGQLFSYPDFAGY